MTLFDIFKKQILSPTGVIEKAINIKMRNPHDTRKYIKDNFSSLIEQLQIDAYHIYLQEEKRVGEDTIELYIKSKSRKDAKAEDIIKTVKSLFTEFDRFYLSLTQSRRPRAGLAFEVIIKTLFKKLRACQVFS